MFYALANLKSATIFEVLEPWNWTKTQLPPELLAAQNKVAYAEYCYNFGTQHAFFSAVEGLDPRVRVSYGVEGGNPALRIHALVVDYDAPITPDMVAHLLAKPPSEFIPSYLSTSYSGNARLMWLFESPVLVATKDQAIQFIIQAQKNLKLTKWGPGLDTDALSKYPTQYYEIGRDWRQPFPKAKPIPAAHLSLWLYEASKKLRLASASYDIPLELVAAEVEKQYPGRWTSAFVMGAVGVRFWDPKADNPRGCQVLKDGMLVFSGGSKGFMSWRELLGAAFVEEFQADRISPIREKTVYDGQKFWRETEPEKWVGVAKDDFGQFLRVQGFSSAKPKGGASEIDQVEHDIKMHRRVVGAFPFLHHPIGIVLHNNERYLNYSTVKAMVPAPPITSGIMTLAHAEKYCPWTYRFLQNFFEPDAGTHGAPPLTYFLAWLKRFYEGARELKPVSGQVLVIAGPTGKGKTLLSRGIIARMTGRYEDGSDVLVSGSQWTDTMSDASVIGIDDTLASNNASGHARFTSMMKKLVANTSISFNGKYKQQGTLPWAGRVVVTCNLDPESIKILPNMELSVLDKIMLFKAAESKKDFPPRDELEELLAQELPFLCRFLLDWAYPDAVLSGETRFGIASYHHSGIHRSAINQGVSQTVLEMLRSFANMERSQSPDKTQWRGSAMDLFHVLSAIHSYGMTRMSPSSLGTALGLLQSRGYPVEQADSPGVTEWIIPLDWSTLSVPVINHKQGNNGSKPAREEQPIEISTRN